LSRCNYLGTGLVCLGAALGLATGCDYSRDRVRDVPTGTYRSGMKAPPGSTRSLSQPVAARDSTERAAILASSMELIQRASLQPGGDNFGLAIQKLNQFFEGTPQADYQLEPAGRAFLQPQLPPERLSELETTVWSRRDARHVEDCMLYYGIASRVGGTGDDLDRVRRVFNWIERQIQLVPAGSLGSPQLRQVPARPYDVLLRGLATESEGSWAERSWLFMALCRQLGVDVGLVTYSKGNIVEPLLARAGQSERGVDSLSARAGQAKPAIPWLCAALVGGQAYLFDTRVGMPVPGPDGQGVATLNQALADPVILERMNLPGLSPYGTSRASLLASPSRIGILIDSSQGLLSPRMKLLQRDLAGKNRTILYKDPSEQRDHFAQVLGDRCGEIKLWGLPIDVETRLFGDPRFVQSSAQSLLFFRPEYPLIVARIKHLRGDLSEAIQEYVSFRLAENLMQVNDKKKPIPKEIQDGLNIYATKYLALAHLERNNRDLAESMFLQLLDLLSEPSPNQPYYSMLRWGAHANLGRIYEAKGDLRRAIDCYVQNDPTMQYHGNLLRARELLWQDPMSAADPIPLARKAPPIR
jgi:Tetratricopeptide repeat